LSFEVLNQGNADRIKVKLVSASLITLQLPNQDVILPSIARRSVSQAVDMTL
jgi:hypothetical protein